MSKATCGGLAGLGMASLLATARVPQQAGWPPASSPTAPSPAAHQATQCRLWLPGGAEAPRLASCLQAADEQTCCMSPSQ